MILITITNLRRKALTLLRALVLVLVLGLVIPQLVDIVTDYFTARHTSTAPQAAPPEKVEPSTGMPQEEPEWLEQFVNKMKEYYHGNDSSKVN
ncbi:hypothetical protein [Calderihabitans maritimus]|uniref:Uncharacterized protein n=1 Tax=Calderihabitans maritimus TaxID=1246530 RepID=A0A1Z5HQ74_9FIRM|nr:hypothetical protein [Calderihabitans maritimus]GAW91682.1 hypothetical protein KKC1_08430 [Calderihabitans maritimus]